MGLALAVVGKGGTGKTTLAAVLVRQLAAGGIRPVLAVDADPNHNLAPALGLAAGPTLGEIREDLLKGKAGAGGVPKGRLLGQRLAECLVEAEGFDLLTMGRPEGPCCYCYVNNLLREALRALDANYRATVVDNEAGMEHVSRLNLSSVDCLLAVSQPSAVSARSAARIVALASELGVRTRRQVLAWNQVGPGGVPAAAREALGAARFDAEVELPADDGVARLAAEQESVFAIELPEAFAALAEACLAGLHSEPSGRKVRA